MKGHAMKSECLILESVKFCEWPYLASCVRQLWNLRLLLEWMTHRRPWLYVLCWYPLPRPRRRTGPRFPNGCIRMTTCPIGVASDSSPAGSRWWSRCTWSQTSQSNARLRPRYSKSAQTARHVSSCGKFSKFIQACIVAAGETDKELTVTASAPATEVSQILLTLAKFC